MKKIISVATSAAMVFSFIGQPSYVMASGMQQVSENIENVKTIVSSKETKATTAATKSVTYYSNEAYSKLYRMNTDNIQSFSNNGGHWASQVLKYAFDGDVNTYWETNKGNTTSFSNEVEVVFNNPVTLNRIVYGARPSDRKGFAQEFEIYASTTAQGENYELVATGMHNKVSGLVEAKFAPTEFKRLKFVFKKSDQNWATLSELAFYTEDVLDDKMSNLFTDSTMSELSSEYNTPEKIAKLEAEAQQHPLYDQYKEDLENAKILASLEKTEATTASMKSVDYYTNEKYSTLFRVSSNDIKSFKNNGGQWASQALKNAFDGDLNTYWETGTGNTAEFSNEVEVEFNEAVTLNRILYGARPSDRKGFAQEFELFGSKTSKGDTYELVATGTYDKVSGLVEAKFAPTEFRRLKFVFKKSDQNWATLSELALYKEDELDNIMDGLFTDGTKSAVVADYNSIAELNALEEKAMEHPLYSSYKEDLELAKKLVNGEVDLEGKIIKVEQRGDMRKHAQQNLRMNFGTNNLPTGLVAKPGDTITVYVEGGEVKAPSLVFTQQEGSWNSWSRSVSLKPGKNVITVPAISQSSYHHEVVKGGTIYISNPYTSKEQGKAPVLRFEGVEKIPMMTLDTDPETFKEELIAYKKKIDEDVATHPNVADRKVVNVVEMVSNHVIFTGTATEAYEQFITKGNNPTDTLTGYDLWMKQIFKHYGLDGSSELNDPKLMRENIRLMQPYGAMYAAGDHTGIQSGTIALMLSDFSKTSPGWGLNHEIGHRLAIGEREYGEVTNNMVSMLMSVEAHNLIGSALDNRIPYESTVYKYVIEENKVTMASQGYFARLGAYWQLELAHPGYWAELSKMYRERKLSANTDLIKQQYYVELSSEVLGYDLSSYFARHGFTVTDETRAKTAVYPEPKKLWYLNDSVINYEGNGIADKNASIDYSVTMDAAKNTLNFKIDKAYSSDILGYEIYRDGELIGFTSTNQFEDSTDTTVNHTYQIIAYDKKLNTLNPVEFKAFSPKLSVEEQLTLKLNQKFDPTDYVKAVDYQGNDITGKVVVKSNNVDVTKKGNYKVLYEVQSEGTTLQKTTNVIVTSTFDYASDLTAESTKVGFSQFKKDNAPDGSGITLLRQGVEVEYSKGIGVHANSEVVYDIEGKGYDYFESYIGIDYAKDRTRASATFEVYVDGEKKFSSDVMKTSKDHEFVKVPVTGAKKVKLVTTDAGDSNTQDHTVWADAKFTMKSSAPILTIPTSDTGVEMVKYQADFDLKAGVTATDAEDGNLIKQVKVDSNGFTTNKTGIYNVKYSVTDSDGNTVSKERKIIVYSSDQYASDMQWTSATAGWKTVQRDKNIEGNTMQLLVNGQVKEFTKGIGTHATSEIVYDLSDMNVEYFETYVGVDRNFTWNTGAASVNFSILADGEEVYNSGLMKYGTEAKHVIIPVKGVEKLKLVVNDAGNGTDSDRADFADAKFYILDSKPELEIPASLTTKVGEIIDINQAYSAIDIEDGDLTSRVVVEGVNAVNFNRPGKYPITYTVTDRDGNTVTKTRTIAVVNMEDYQYVTDYDWNSVKYSYAAPIKDKAISGNALRLTDENNSVVTYKRGIGAHSISTIVYDLTDKNVDYFTSYVGVDRQMYNSVGSVSFEVYVDDVKKFDSGVMKSTASQQYVEVALNGAKELKLVVTDGGNGNGSDHATWGDAKFHFANENRVYTGDLERAIKEAQAISLDEEYTEESVHVLTAKLAEAQALLTKENVTQSEVDATLEALQSAVEGLTKIDMTQVVLIKDNTLKAAIKKTLGVTEELTLGDLYKLTELTYHGARETIKSLEGLEYAKNLVTLDITGNEVTDFSPLKDLKKLTNLKASPQYKLMDMVKGPNISLENLVIDIEGNKVLPKVATLRHNTTNEETVIDTNEWSENLDSFTIDMTNYESGMYTLFIGYEVNGNLIQLVYMVKHSVDLTQIVDVKDSKLRNVIKETLGVTGDLTIGDMYKLTELTYHGARETIKSLEGLEYAKNLATLDITGNEVTDFSPLKDLKKLTNLKANPQLKLMDMVKGPNISLENLVTDIDGNKVLPTEAVLRNNTTSETTLIDMNEWSDDLNTFNIDMTEQGKAMYTLTLAYNLNGNLIQIVYMLNNK